MSFVPKTPYLTVDAIVEVFDGSDFVGIVLIERHNKPLGVALPGGFVDIGESVEDAVYREAKEEIGVDIKNPKLLGVYSDPARDSRFHTVSIVYVAQTTDQPVAGDDAKSLSIYTIENLPLDRLVFDHRKIVEDYLKSR